MIIAQKNNYTYLSKILRIIILKRTMVSTSRVAHSAYKAVVNLPSTQSSPTQILRKGTSTQTQPTICNMSTRNTYKFAKNKGATNYSTDDKKEHAILVETICDEKTCVEKTCQAPCNTTIVSVQVQGHFTHKPPTDITKDSVFLSNTDINGKQKDQHFVKEKVGAKNIPVEELKNLTEDDMIPKPDAKKYAAMSGISNVIDNFLK